jgi:hypothetical protein
MRSMVEGVLERRYWLAPSTALWAGESGEGIMR